MLFSERWQNYSHSDLDDLPTYPRVVEIPEGLLFLVESRKKRVGPWSERAIILSHDPKYPQKIGTQVLPSRDGITRVVSTLRSPSRVPVRIRETSSACYAEIWSSQELDWVCAVELKPGCRAASLLPYANDRALAIGGLGHAPAENPFPSSEVVDINFSDCTTTVLTPFPQPIIRAHAFLLPSHQVFLLGGMSHYTREEIPEQQQTFIASPPFDHWDTADVPGIGRNGPIIAQVHDGDILIAGGGDGVQEQATNSCRLYSATKNTWQDLAPSLNPRTFAGHVVIGNSVVVVGGTSRGYEWVQDAMSVAEVYDGDSDTWSTLPSLNRERMCPTVAWLDNVGVIVAGGVGRQGSGVTSIEILAES